MFRTPKRNKVLLEESEIINITPPDKILKPKVLNNSDKEPVNGSSPNLGSEKSALSPGEIRRGRPRAEILNALILEGSTSPSSIKCPFCGRVFPREKSLQAHRRTHTGEKPYACDYPRCNRKFAQSGQLKTHQRLHTGERPFICSAPNCKSRFVHANRRCPSHPDAQLKRYNTSPNSVNEKKFDEAHNAEVRQWFLNNSERVVKRSLEELHTTPKKTRFKPQNSNSSSNEGSSSYYPQSINCAETLPDTNKDDTEMSRGSSSECSETDTLIGHTSKNPLNSLLPKKRWLRAVQDQQHQDNQAPLAVPLNWGDEVNSVDNQNFKAYNDENVNFMNIAPFSTSKSPVKSQNTTPMREITNYDSVVIENQKRPTVLKCVSTSANNVITHDDMEGAIALVQLKEAHCNHKYRI